MKILAKIAVLALCAGVPALAQGGGADSGQMLQKMTKNLGLTQDQQTKVAEAMKLPKGPRRRQAIMAILTPEQKAKVRKAQAARRQRRAAAGSGAKGGGESNE